MHLVLFTLALAADNPITTEIEAILSNVSGILTAIGAGVCIIGIVVGGLMRATSFGNERKVARSNQAIAAAVIGLLIVLLAQGAATAIPALL